MVPMPGLLCALLLAVPAQTAAAQSAPAPLNPRERAVHLLNRLAFGPAPGEVDRLLAMGETAWLDEQLRAAPAQDPRLTEALAGFQTLDLSPAGAAQWVYQDYTGRGKKDEDLSEEERQQLRERRRVPGQELIQSVLYRAALSDRRAEEVLADFWRNHFNVSFTKGDAIEVQINDYERMVLRRNLFGKFPDMLIAAARHAAMLNYLDNAVSRRPPSKQELAEIERNVKRRTGSEERAAEEVQIAAERGLNENYAREVMELHTLGVDNGYDQDDVIALAQALTGWTYEGGRRASQEFTFRADMHVTGDKRVLGRNFAEDKEDGPGQGLAILAYLAEHRNTARFLATKLTRYLVNDAAPPAVVDQAAKVFLKTDGDIPATVRAIVSSDEFWARDNFEAKFKTPFEFVISAVRATGAEITDVRVLSHTLESMNQPVYYCDDPTGWYDTAEAWLDPGVLALRWQFAIDLAEGRLKGVRIPESFWTIVPEEAEPETWQHHLTLILLPEGAGERTRAALATVTTEYLAKKKVPDLRELGPQLVGLLLGSPEFQKQ